MPGPGVAAGVLGTGPGLAAGVLATEGMLPFT